MEGEGTQPEDTAETPQAPRAQRALALVGISCLALFLEMALIRFSNSTVQLLAYFNNFVILSSFLGLGLGALLSKRRGSLLWTFPFGLVALVASLVLLDAHATVGYESADLIAWVGATSDLVLPAWLVVTGVFLGTLGLFVPLGTQLGVALAAFDNTLEAYGWDLLGSLLGVLGFALVSWLRLPPWVWFTIAALLALILSQSKGLRRGLEAAALIACVALTLVPSPGLWSPYYKVQFRAYETGEGADLGFAVVVDKLRIQDALNLEALRETTTSLGAWLPYYELPLKFRDPGRVLVLGGGSGNDTAAALAAGATSVTVVEIDPVLIELGKELHPHRPYADPRVTAINADARTFLRTSEQRFDLIVMNALDSHLQAPGLSTLRLESFVYTVEAFREIARLTDDSTLVVVQLSSSRPWMGERLYASLTDAFGKEPTLFYPPDSPFKSVAFVYGPAELLARPPAGSSFMDPAPFKAALPTTVRARDDWPHLYLRSPQVPGLYQLVLVLVVGLTVAIFGAFGGLKVSKGFLHFFLLGAAFMLLEASALTRFALLFGSTWLVNAVVVAAILVVISAGNALLWKGLRVPRAVSYGGLLAFLVLVYAVPLDAFLGQGAWTRALLSGLWVGLPVFFASLVFSTSFRETQDTASAFGANLLGVVVGGSLEYLSMVHGLEVLLGVAGLLYLGAFASDQGRGARA